MFDTDGPVAEEIVGLWWFLLVLGIIVFVAFAVALAVALRRGRAGKEGGEPTSRSLRRWVIGGGAVLPAVVLVVVLVFTVASMRALPADAPTHALRVEVVGHRWWYEIRYPDHGVVTANELHLPVDRPIELALTSDDVIHSFWVPALGGKLDMLPDRTNTLVLQADEIGEHRTSCAEFCGLQHARMRLLTVVETDDDFDAWVDANRTSAQEPGDAAAARGQDVYFDAGCASCHTVRGTQSVGTEGPDLTHLASRQTLGAVT
ncbi:MAG: cytochrome c oxidase subunit II, partial [Acidimicrobiia bacterium]